MKKIQTLLLAALCGAAFSVSAQTGVPGYATVVRVEGAAFYSLGAGQDEHPLVAGKVLPVGATIRTEDNGIVDVVLGKAIASAQASSAKRLVSAADNPVRGLVSYEPSVEQNVVRLTPDTTLAIDKLNVTDTGADTVSDTELNLKKGKIYASVKKLTGASQYLIKLPNGIAGVRGTLFVISADGTVSVSESTGGGVVLSLVSADGTTHTYLVGARQSFDPATGQTLTISNDVASKLGKMFSLLRTIFGSEAVNYSFDTTTLYVSPVHGY